MDVPPKGDPRCAEMRIALSPYTLRDRILGHIEKLHPELAEQGKLTLQDVSDEYRRMAKEMAIAPALAHTLPLGLCQATCVHLRKTDKILAQETAVDVTAQQWEVLRLRAMQARSPQICQIFPTNLVSRCSQNCLHLPPHTKNGLFASAQYAVTRSDPSHESSPPAPLLIDGALR